MSAPAEHRRSPARPVALGELARALGAAVLDRPEAAALPLTDVTHDSRQAGPGVLFACRPGATADGHDFAPVAVAGGSPALLLERHLALDVPQVRVASVAESLGLAAAALHGQPSADMTLLGVTGTNGKTTTVFLLERILAAAAHTTGLIGTIETRIAGERVPGVRTTPESTDLQRLLARMLAAGVTGAAMEVSSHALALGRVNGTRFEAAVFTNLTQDHLDFHRDLDEYFTAKARLFTPEHTRRGVVNVDDPFGARLAATAAGRIEIVPVSPAGDPAVAVRAEDVELRPGSSRFTARLHSAVVPVHTTLPGHFNVANALCALAAAEVAGVDPRVAAEGIAALRGVPGRMERVDAGQAFGVVVDYAHTPDSLRNVLRAAREVTPGRLIVVIGCGGDRDRDKRPVMGRAAAELADLAVLTSDNPRSEDPAAILAAVAAGAAQVPGARYTVELDRRAGIAAALDAARPDDLVLLAGKGHETTQEFADRVISFDDRQVARELLAQRSGAA